MSVSSPTPAIAPYVPSYAVRAPYITRQEFLDAPTGVDLSNLQPGGGQASNDAALDNLIASASSYADVICDQILCATSDVEVGIYRAHRGYLRVPVSYTPLVAVTAVMIGRTPSSLTALTDLSGLWIEQKVVRIPVAQISGPVGVSYPGLGIANGGLGSEFYTQVTYVNGFANTVLGSSCLEGAASVTVENPVGIFPGLEVTIYDTVHAASELVTVGAGYVLGSAAVPLVSPTQFAHDDDTSISCMPLAVKRATILLTAHFVKTRGADAVVLNSLSGGPAEAANLPAGSTEELEQAIDLLAPFRRVR